MTLRISRRHILQGTAGLAMPAIWTGSRAFAAERITVADVGGAPGAAIKQTFYDPFEKETGIQVVGVAHEADPSSQFKLAVDTKSYIWDVCMVDIGQVAYLSKPRDYLEPIGFTEEDGKGFIPGAVTPVWLGFSTYGIIMAYRTDKFGANGPKNWADFFDVEKFPGRRGLFKDAQGPVEVALMADGVPADKLYPLDLDRAFKMLDKIKSSVAVWWTSGAQNTQILQNGEVDLTDTWSARAFAAADSGAPVKIVWDGLYSTDGWSIPKGSPRADLARKFIRFCMQPERQGAYCSLVANGPSNLKAYDFIKPERAALLPTYPANFKNLSPLGDIYWAENSGPIEERFQNWLLAG